MRADSSRLPAYLQQIYHWAYLDRRLLGWLDRPQVVSAILWGNANRLIDAALAEFRPGQRVLQAAAVYGDFSLRLAHRLGEEGALDVLDVAPLQIANLRRKARSVRNLRARVHDLSDPLPNSYAGICCFFLLHEVPTEVRCRIVANLLEGVSPGGKVVFVDYHRPSSAHPLGLPMRWMFRRLEPFAESLLKQDIATLSEAGARFEWRRTLHFGGLYQIVVARAPAG